MIVKPTRLLRAQGLLLLAAIAAFCSSTKADWTTYQGDAAHDGFVAENVTASGITLGWTNPIATSALGAMAIGDNAIYLTAPIVNMVSINETTGAALWTNPYVFGVGTGDVYSISAPAYSNGEVYYQTDNESDVNLFRGVNALTGAQISATPYTAQFTTYLNPTPYNGHIYTGGGRYGGMYSYTASTGSQNWFGAAGNYAYDGWTPSTDGKYLYSYTGSGNVEPISGQFRMINMSTGATTYLVTDTGFQWSGYTMNSAVVLGTHNDAFIINGPGTVYPNYSNAGRLLCFNTQADATHTPYLEWAVTDHFTGQPTLANGVLYTDDGGKLVALDELTGNQLWSWTAPTGNLTGTLVATDDAVFACTATTTYAVDLNTHQSLWSYAASGNLAIDNYQLFIAGSNGTLYSFVVPEPTLAGLLAPFGIGALLRRKSVLASAPA